MAKKVYIVDGNRYGEEVLFNSKGWERTHVIGEADLVVFTGGADISPAIYGEAKHPYTHTQPKRDELETRVFETARDLGKPILGICRGAQLACAMMGGTLFQHAPHEVNAHWMLTDDGEHIYSSSTHHQMMRPGKGAIIKAWVNNLAPCHQFMGEGSIQNIEVVEKEAEVVLWPEERVLAVQGHPEFYQQDEEFDRFREYVFEQINSILVPTPACAC